MRKVDVPQSMRVPAPRRQNVVWLRLLYNAFEPETTETHELKWRKGVTLNDLLDGLPADQNWMVFVNGGEVDPLTSGTMVLDREDTVGLILIPQGGDGLKSILRLVVEIAAVAIGYWLGGPLGAAIGAMVGGLISQFLLTPKPKTKSQDDSQTYGIDGAKNSATEGIPYPVVYGEFRTAGNFSDTFTVNQGDTQYLFLRAVLNDGQIDSVSDIEINEQPISNFSECSTAIALGTLADSVNPWFVGSNVQVNKGVKIDTGWTTHETTTAVDRVRFDVLFQTGLVKIKKKNGNYNNASVTFETQYRLKGDTTWQNLTLGSWSDGPAHSYTDTDADDAFSGAFASIFEQYTKARMSVTYPVSASGTAGVSITDANGNAIYSANVDGAPTQGYALDADGNLAGTTIQPTANQTFEVELAQATTGATTANGLNGATINSLQYFSTNGSNRVTVTDNVSKQVRRSFESEDLPRGIYEVRIRRTTATSTDSYLLDEVYLTDVDEIQNGVTGMRGIANLAVKIKLDDQLNSIPQLTALVRGSLVQKYDIDGNKTVKEWSNNPAWIALDMLCGEERGAGLNLKRVDWPRWLDLADHCEANNLAFNGVFSEGTTLGDALQQVLRVGHAALVPFGTKLSIAIDRVRKPVGAFTMANIIKDTFQVGYMSVSDRSNEFELSYYDKTDRNKEKTIRYVDPKAVQFNETQRLASIQMPGIDNIDQARAELWRLIYQNRLLIRTIQFDAWLNAINVGMGENALIQHDQMQWANSGMLKAGSTATSIVLDQKVEWDSDESYHALVAFDAVSRGTRKVSSVVGSKVLVTGASIQNLSVTRMKVGTADYEVVSLTDGTSYHTIQLAGAATPAIAAASTVELWDTDVVEEVPVQSVATNAQGTSTVTLASALSGAPAALSPFVYGQVELVNKPYTLTGISGNGLEKRSLTWMEYDERVYGPAEVELPVPTAQISDRDVAQVTGLLFDYDQILDPTKAVVNARVHWQAGSIRNYGGGDIYIRLNGSNWRTLASAANVTEYHFQLSPKDAVELKVVAYNTRGDRAPINKAPSVSDTVDVSHLDVNEPGTSAWSAAAFDLKDDNSSSPAIKITGACDNRDATQVAFFYRKEGDTEWSSAGTVEPTATEKVINSVAAKTTYLTGVANLVNGKLSTVRELAEVTTGVASVDWGTGVNGDGKPEDGATVGAPPGTTVGGKPAEDVVKNIDDLMTNVDDLQQAVGSSQGAAQSASDAAASASSAQTAASNAAAAQTNAQTANTNAQAAVTAANQARDTALDYKTAAAGSASTASTAAGNAATANTNAQAAVTAAQGARDLALQYQAGSQSARDAAQTAATNASSSASTASTQASLAVGANSAANAAAASLFPERLDGTSNSFSNVVQSIGSPSAITPMAASVYVAATGYGTVAQFALSTSVIDVSTVGVLPFTDGRFYKVEWEVQVASLASGDTPSTAAFMRCLDGSYTSVGSGNTSAHTIADTNVHTYSAVWGVNASGGDVNITTTGVTWLRPVVRLSATKSGSIAQLRRIKVTDVTSQILAGQSASAASTSATNASASATTASQQATISTNQASAAQTSAGSASTYANNALASQNSASGSASTATTQAGIATTAATNAGNSASAAAGSASTASSKADAAGQSATAASASATQASTSAGSAQTYASNASTSASNAAGSANTASTQAGVASSAASNAVQQIAALLPSDFQNDGTFWATNYQGAPTRASIVANSVYSFPASGSTMNVAAPPNVATDVSSLGAVTVQAGRQYLITASFNVTALGTGGSAPPLVVYGLYLDQNYVNFGNIATTQAITATGPGTLVRSVSGDAVLAANATMFRPIFRANLGGNSRTGLTYTINSIVVEDITESTAAGASATAAATSASNAATSATSAGTSATSAQTSATTATTQAGNAQTFANNASTSATSALGYANTASTQAGVSATNAGYAASFATGNLIDQPTFDSVNVGNWIAGSLVADTGPSGVPHTYVIKNAGVDMRDGPQRSGNWANRTIRCQGWVKNPTGAANVGVGIIGVNASGASINSRTNITTTTGWTQFDVTVSTLSTFVTAVPWVRSDAPYGVLWTDLVWTDVTESTLAAGSASAAAGSASTASTAATNAGNSATAASTSATNASTSAGNAQTYANNASTSATNAQGYANTASTQAGVASSAASGAVQQVASAMPSDFSQGSTFWADGYSNAPSTRTAVTNPNYTSYLTVSGVGPVIQVTPPANTYYDFSEVGTMPVAQTNGRRYRATVVYRMTSLGSGGSRRLDVYIIGLTSSYGGGTNYSTTHTPTATNTLYTVTVEMTSDTLLAANCAFMRVLPRSYNLNGNSGAVFQFVSVTLEDITEGTAAGASATAAAISASNASTSATNAGQSATAASASATQANTAAGNAQTYASNASTSASNAAGSATSAATQAGVSATNATAAQTAAMGTFPTTFEQGTIYFGGDTGSTTPRNLITATSSDGLPVLQSSTTSDYGLVSWEQAMPYTPGRTYRVSAKIKATSSTTGTCQLRISVYDKSTGGNRAGLAQSAYLPVTTAWQTFTATATPTYAGSFVRPEVILNYNPVVSGVTQQIALISLEDITESTNAAGSASAAATSASNASQSATNAGQSASAASGSATTASTAASNAQGYASNAQTYASNASTSASNAQGYANTASTQAGLASTSASNAAGSATAAGNSATVATTQAGNASNSASAASSSALQAISTAASTLPSDFSQGSAFWADDYRNSPSVRMGVTNTNYTSYLTVSGIGPVIQVTPPDNSAYDFSETGAMPVAATNGRRYRATVVYRMTSLGAGTAPTLNLYIIGLNAAYANVTNVSTYHTPTAINTLYTVTLEQTSDALLANGNVFMRVLPRSSNNSGGSGAVFQYVTVKLEDVTESTTAAASSAAAAGYASNAQTSANAAAGSATSASGSANTASTQAGNAATSATAASNSAAAASTSAAAASSSATLAASIGLGSLNANPVFGAWSGTFPDSWLAWAGNNPTKATGATSPNAVRMSAAANVQQGLKQNIPSLTATNTGDWVVLEADVILNSGVFGGSGVLLQPSSGGDTKLSFATDKDSTDTVVGNGAAGTFYSFRKLIQIPSGGNTANVFYMMNHWGGFGPAITAANDITWLRAAVRFATQAEIAAQRADANASTALANITSEASTRAAADSALATRATNLEATVNNGSTGVAALASRVSTSEGAIATLNDRTEAWWDVNVQSGTGRAAVAIKADGVAGSSSIDLVAGSINLSTTADGHTYKQVFGIDTNGNASFTGDIYAGAGRIIWDNGSVMKVAGTGFGSSNQFIEWFGPKMAITSCTEANATYYLKTNGSAYFGGALSAGTLTTKAATSDTSASAIAETPVFGSNGKTITVTLSLAYSASETDTYPGTQAGVNSWTAAANGEGATVSGRKASGGAADSAKFTVDLYRSVNGGAYAKVTTLTVTSNWSVTGTAPDTGGSLGTLKLFDSASGSLTYTDPQLVAQNRQYKAVMTGRGPKYTANMTQMVGLVCVEQ